MTALLASPAITVLVRVTIILALGLLVASRVRSSAPELRHLLLLAAIGSALALPLAFIALPHWDAPLLPSRVIAAVAGDEKQVPRVARDDNETRDISEGFARNDGWLQDAKLADDGWRFTRSGRRVIARAGSLSLRAPTNPATTLVVIWLVGGLVAMLLLAAAYTRLHRITQRAWQLALPEWRRLLDDERARARVSADVALLVSPVASTPLTWGSRRPVILLPEDALDWPVEHRRVVLRHELAHIARRDAAAQLIAGVACAVYWFHPLVWVAARRLRTECERACDDRVVSSGTVAADYAAHLLDVARSSRSLGGPGFLSVAMARPSQLEGRLLAILDGHRHIALSMRSRVAAVSFSVLIVAAVSGFRAVPRSASMPVLSVAHVDAAPARLATSLVVAQGTTRNDTTFEKSVDVKEGETLTLDLVPTGGGLTITGWDQPRVRVRATLAGRSWRETEVKLESDGDGARLQTRYLGQPGNTAFSHRFLIDVPRHFNLRVNSAGGPVTIANVDGHFRGSTGGGGIDIQHAGGDVALSTGGGDISVSASDLRGSVSTGGGAVRISNVIGGVIGNSGSGQGMIYLSGGVAIRAGSGSGSGFGRGEGRSIGKEDINNAIARAGVKSDSALSPNDIKELTKLTRVSRERRSNGDIILSDVPNGASMSTGGGDIRIARTGGSIFANTGAGDIEIGRADGSVDASTGAGNVSVVFAGSGAHSGELTTGNGTITLTLPSDLSATVILETAYTNNFNGKTRIDSDWPITVTESPDWDASQGTPRRYVRSRLVLGSGEGVIKVRAVNGNVVVKRGP